MLNIDKFDAEPLNTSPYEYVVINDFLTNDALSSAQADYPEVPGPGSHPSSVLSIHGNFAKLVAELQGPAFQEAVEKKFDIDLTDCPTMYTVRGFCRSRDGKIHTDSKTKIITVLLYMNEADWPSEGGKLRVLNNGTNLEDYAAEIEPKGGTLLVFKRADNSWHGHHSFEGKRRAVQLNWVTEASVVKREQSRHGFSSKLKKLFGK